MYSLREGQMVRLKSNGPRMTVDKLRPQGRVTCVWFVGDTLLRETFHMNALNLVPVNEVEVDVDSDGPAPVEVAPVSRPKPKPRTDTNTEDADWADAHRAALDFIEEIKDGGSNPKKV